MQTLARILIADDHTFSLRVIVHWLRDEGYFCDYIPDSQEIRAVIEVKPYDVLIADHTVFSRQELDVLRILYHTRHHIPVLLVTPASTLPVDTESRRFGIMEYLFQPLDAPALVQRVRQVMTHERGWLMSPQGDTAFTYSHNGIQTPEAASAPIRTAGAENGLPLTLTQHLEQTITHLTRMTSNLRRTLKSLKQHSDSPPPDLCAPLACPRATAYETIVHHTIAVLRQTPNAFTPQTLEALREALEALADVPPERPPLPQPTGS